MNSSDLKISPHSYEGEKSLLSCIMMDNKILYYITDFKKSYFFDKELREIFGIMVELHQAKRTIDPVIIGERFENMELLWDISTFCNTPINYKEYVQVIKDNYVYRKTIKDCHLISGMCQNKEPVEDVAKKLQKAVENSFIDEDKLQTINVDVTSRVMEYFKNIEDRKNGINEMSISTGYSNLDEVMVGGLKKGHLNFIAGRPGSGKTLISLNIIENIVKQGKVGMFVSLEMTKDQLVDRIISRNTKISMQNISKANLSQDDVVKISNVGENIMKYKLYLDDKNKGTIETIRAKLMESDEKIDVLVIDYIQLMKISGKSNGAYEDLTNIANGLKELAKEFELCLIGIVQLNRSVESRPNKRPLLSDMSGSGAFENNADCVIGLYRDEYYDKDTDRPGLVEMEILKNRHGETKVLYGKFNGPNQEITETEFEEDEIF